MSCDGKSVCPKCGLDKDGYDDDERTVREYYEQGILNGEYFVDYNGNCIQCDFTFEFKHRHKFNFEDKNE